MRLPWFAYGYDVANRLTDYTGPEGTLAYGYDATDQLTSVSGARSETFSYDANGNRTMSGYTTGTGNRLTSDGTYDYTYDDNGNTIVKSKSGERWEYTWDHRNRLVNVKELTGAGGTLLYEASYTYDVNDRRIGILEDADAAGGASAVQTWMAYEGENTWADFDAGGSLVSRYLNGLAMDERYARVLVAGTVQWYLGDNLGR